MPAMTDDPFATAAGNAPAGPQFGGTERQGDYLRDLRGQLRDVHVELHTLRGDALAVEATSLSDAELADLTAIRSKSAASQEIDRVRQALAERRRELRIEKNDARNRQAPAAPAADEITDGMYLRDGVIIKAQYARQGSGRLYAKVLDTETGRFEYAPGVVKTLRAEHRLTLEAAKEYGALYGMCVCCGATLTDEDSIAAGIGPICAGKL